MNQDIKKQKSKLSYEKFWYVFTLSVLLLFKMRLKYLFCLLVNFLIPSIMFRLKVKKNTTTMIAKKNMLNF